MIYIGLFTLLHVPFFQEKLGEKVSSYLSDYLETPVSINKIDIGLLNQAILSDIVIQDPEGETLLSIDKASTSFEILPLLNGDVKLSTIQLFSAEAHLSKKAPDSPLNIQFIIDKLSSKEDNKPKKEFTVNTIVVRNSSVHYDVLSEPIKEDQLDKNHLNLQNFDLTCRLHDIKPETLNIDIDALSFEEKNSSLSLHQLSTSIRKDSELIKLKDLDLNVNNSSLKSNLLTFDIESTNSGNISISGDIFDSQICPSDFSSINPSLKSITSTLDIRCDFSFVGDNLHLEDLRLTADDRSLNIDGDFHINRLGSKDMTIDADVRKMNIDMEKMLDYLPLHNIDNTLREKIRNLGNTEMEGVVNYNRDYIQVKSRLLSSIGDVSMDGIIKNLSLIDSHISCKSLNLDKLFPEIALRNTSFDLDVNMDLKTTPHPQGLLKGTISHLEYSEHIFDNIYIDGQLNNKGYNGLLSVHDNKIDGEFKGNVILESNSQYSVDAQLSLNKFYPSAVGIKSDLSNHQFDVDARINMKGSNIEDISGELSVNRFGIHGIKHNYDFNDISLTIQQKQGNYKDLEVKSNIISGNIKGVFDFESLPETFLSSINGISPSKPSKTNNKQLDNNNFAFDLTISDHPLLHKLIDKPIAINDNVHISGNLNNTSKLASYNIYAPFIEYEDNSVSNLYLAYNREAEKFNIETAGKILKGQTSVDVGLNMEGKNHLVNADIDWKLNQEKPISGKMHLDGELNITDEHIAHLRLLPSEVDALEQSFDIESEYLDIYKDHIDVKELKAISEDRSLVINGTLSNNPSDSMMVNLNGTTIGSVLKMVNTNVKNLDGYVYGSCNVYDILHSPRLNANLYIDDLQFKNNNLGHAYILANWDNQLDGIHINANVMKEEIPDGLTTINGYIYPDNKDLNIKIGCNNTDASFLSGLLFRPFREVTGKINGDIKIFGPFNNIDIQGAASADTKLTLRATGVTYSVSPEDSIRLTSNSFIFNNIHISDKDKNTNIINGVVTHENFKNFSYTFDMNIENLLLYEETNFNSDKFKGKIYGDGTFHLNGSDGHPLYITSDIYPAKGSEFSYDASTPDAITTNSFINFREITPTDSILLSAGVDPDEYWYNKDSLNNIDNEEVRKYRGDIFMNLNIHMNHNCPVKLKMDNVEDGYITTYGTGVLHADYHNKGSFSLNGTYKIQEGKYRLYLQDIIYRDLILQDGSNVVFNGNPFDADIHLICWHTLQSVPLSDLTSAVYTQNNRVRVICILDITGHLGNMNFQFDLNLPNVSDETRQIVRSYISTDEEMNKQLIYLLGFGRFYTNEYARANSDTNTTNQAMNSLLSSTLSGQINQMLSNAIGSESKWNFGTGISTGERGWEDVDVEGTLSGKLLDDRLLINGNFGYRDNSMTNNSSFIGDFDVRWRLTPTGNTYLKAYNLTNDRYFTKSTLNTQGVGATYQRDFESFGDLFKSKKKRKTNSVSSLTNINTDTVGIVPDNNDNNDYIIFKSDSLNK